jgi:hypothetical protein
VPRLKNAWSYITTTTYDFMTWGLVENWLWVIVRTRIVCQATANILIFRIKLLNKVHPCTGTGALHGPYGPYGE